MCTWGFSRLSRFGSGHDLRVMGWSLTLDSVLQEESTWDSLSSPLSLPLLATLPAPKEIPEGRDTNLKAYVIQDHVIAEFIKASFASFQMLDRCCLLI